MKILHKKNIKDEYFYQGAFWIKGNSIADIMQGKFTITSVKYLCDFYGNYVTDDIGSAHSRSHERLWKEKALDRENLPYNYYPRGRVGISNGTAYINLPSDIVSSAVITAIRDEFYLIDGLKILVSPESKEHYKYLLN